MTIQKDLPALALILFEVPKNNAELRRLHNIIKTSMLSELILITGTESSGLSTSPAIIDTKKAGAAILIATSIREALIKSRADWFLFRSIHCLPNLNDLSILYNSCASQNGNILISGAVPFTGTEELPEKAELADAPPAWYACTFQRDTLLISLPPDETKFFPEISADLSLWHSLLHPEIRIIRVESTEPADLTASIEPRPAYWRDNGSYSVTIRAAFITFLKTFTASDKSPPRWLQLAVLRHLSWYFTIDSRERAPTVIVDDEMAAVFHQLVGEALRHVDMSLLRELPAELAGPEVCHALWSYQRPQRFSAPVADAYDHDQGLLRITYWHHGTPPAEQFIADGSPLKAAYAKYRACNFFGRQLLRQRIAWLPVQDGLTLQIQLDGREFEILVGAQPFSATAEPRRAENALDLDRVRDAFRPGKGDLQRPLPGGWPGWKVRLIKTIARFAPVRRYFRDAWVFVDRDSDADDNAEHLYRWVRKHHPEINAWYLLQRQAPDWARLRAEGFRLLPPGIRRRLLALNCEHVISSHTEMQFGLDPARYGDLMNWRYSFLQHGVTMNDVSHWINQFHFDLVVASGPAETSAMVDDNTPYIYTEREVLCSGLARHDRLLRIAKNTGSDRLKRRKLLAFPTWRANLLADQTKTKNAMERLATVEQSSYAYNWRTFLNSPQLLQCVSAHDWELILMLHVNAEPYLECFSPPENCKIKKITDNQVQPILAKTSVFVTDYTSLAFDLALIRRPIVYFQFDYHEFFHGNHNWRPGYFDYNRDGFGPVTTKLSDAIDATISLIRADGVPDQKYSNNMIKFMPSTDGRACSTIFDAIGRLKKNQFIRQAAS